MIYRGLSKVPHNLLRRIWYPFFEITSVSYCTLCMQRIKNIPNMKIFRFDGQTSALSSMSSYICNAGVAQPNSIKNIKRNKTKIKEGKKNIC